MKRPQDYTVRIDWQTTSRDYGLHNILVPTFRNWYPDRISIQKKVSKHTKRWCKKDVRNR